MRLIDADVLVKDLLEQIPLAENVPIFKDIIESQPTAYDTDKVLEQMEDATAIGADCVGNAFECIPKYMAIEIVKAGGKIYGKVD
jgi:hypothetical protein